MLVARNWAEDGFYGRYLAGQPNTSNLSASYTVVAPVAISFHLFGIGVWQARLPVALLTLGALFLLAVLAGRLFGSRAGWAALLISVLMAPHPLANPIYMGRQVMAEMPMLFYLLAGYVFFALAGSHVYWLGGAMVFWGIAILTKAQLFPFLGVALAGGGAVALLRRQWRPVIYFCTALLGAWVTSVGLNGVWNLLMSAHSLTSVPLAGLTQALALTLDPLSRQSAFWMVMLTGLPVIVALLYESGQLLAALRRTPKLGWDEWVRLSLLLFCASWVAWYALFSIGWARYFMPATFVGSLFVAKAFGDWSGQFSVPYLVQSVGEIFLRRMADLRRLAALWVFLSGLAMSAITLMVLGGTLTSPANLDIEHTASYLNTYTPPGALVECYENEILFWLNRPYHYPPDQVSIKVLMKRVDPNVELGYDPLPADPDYLVIGGFARGVGLYDQVLQGDAFRLIQQFGQYTIYERWR